MLSVGQNLHAQLEQVIDDYLRVYGYDVTAMAIAQQSERLSRIYAAELTEAPHDDRPDAANVLDYIAARLPRDRDGHSSLDEQVT